MNNINQEIKDLEATLVSLKAKAEAQEPTLTPISFESKGELAKALVDGRTFKTTGGHTLMYANCDRGSSPFRVMRDGKDRGHMTGIWSQYIDLLEINAVPAAPWYLNIPLGGVKCYVSDYNPNPYPSSTPVRVTEYDQSLPFPFQCLGDCWKYATPVNEGAIK